MAEKEPVLQEVPLNSYAIEAAMECYRDENVVSLTERKAMENDGTAVTVICISYKHEEFIAQALDSFLMQKTNFKFKIFVGEDCGPDGTADIILEYARKYPDIIVPFIREKNMGAQRNLVDLCQHATSPYIAFCEGDDYWVNEYKLQKQYDYMESHPELRACTTQTEIIAPEDWHLRSWYKELPDGKILIPDSIPGYHRQETFNPGYIININVAHTSTHFYRWNYDLEIPDWYYEGIIGDTPMLLLQLGTTELGHLPEITSAYRINEGSIFFDKDRERNFLRTRLDYVRYLSGLREYAIDHFQNYPVVAIENRIKLEAANYLKILINRQDDASIIAFFTNFPEAGRIALNAYLDFYWDQRSLTQSYTWEGYQLVVRSRYFRRLIKPIVKCVLKLKKPYKRLKSAINKYIISRFKNLLSFLSYWWYSFSPKDKNTWIFGGFDMKTYMDNSKYLYEYILEHHPEINAVWITKNKNIYNQLKAENKPVTMWRTKECRKIASRAELAVIDHFKMSDVDNRSGFNDKTKVVQLWHGVGLKSMRDVVAETTFEGVRYNHDMIIKPEDDGWNRFRKKLWYFRHAYYSERFEHYFMLLCPGKERIEQIAKTMGIPEDRCFMTGHPRNIHLHTSSESEIHRDILYAPTFRWNPTVEKQLCNQIMKSAEEIENYLSSADRNLVIRLHPLTWRNYSKDFTILEEKYAHIHIDREKDVYKTLGNYAILITDYSSIAYDFVLLDRPVIFFNFDYEDYSRHDHSLNYDYNEYSPGIKTATWEETLAAIEEYAANPQKDSQWRCRIRDAFYDMSVNDENNSERIIQEIKRRLEES